MTEIEPLMVDCGPHGKRVGTAICRHLLLSAPAPAGFVQNSDDPNDLQAWCFACEEFFQSEGDMTAAFREFNGMTIVCAACYAEIKIRHSPQGH